MVNSTALRNILLAGASSALIVACSDTNIDSPGSTSPITVNVGGGGTGGGGGGGSTTIVPAGGCTDPGNATNDMCDLAQQLVNGNTFCGPTETLDSAMQILPGEALFVGGSACDTVTTADGVSTAAAEGNDLVIPAGTTLVFEPGGYIVVTRGNRILANGSENNPIIMTSVADIDNPNRDDTNVTGEWGGLVINGSAPINNCIGGGGAVGGDADCEQSGEGSSGLYGGADAADDSGILNYVVLKYAGELINDDDELNGIAFQGVGSETDVNFIQVHNGQDDCVEFFGGTVSANYVVCTGADDDNIDWVEGWTGSLRYALVEQRANASSSDPRGIEADNFEDFPDLTPISNPTISNFTLIGNKVSDNADTGANIRRGSFGTVVNGIITGWKDTGLDIETAETVAAFNTPNVAPGVLNSIYLSDNTENFETTDTETIFTAGNYNATGLNTLTGFFPGANELGVQAVDPVTLADDDDGYIGAFGPTETEEDNWAAGWTVSLFDGGSGGCPAGTTLVTQAQLGDVCRISGTIEEDLLLTADNTYALSGAVFVGRDCGGDGNPSNELAGCTPATLTIAPGTTIYGGSSEDYLVVNRGSRLVTNGTSSNPVVMTSLPALLDPDRDDTLIEGEWGGLVINGKAPINNCIGGGGAVGGDPDCEQSGEGSSGLYGGNVSDDNSGSLMYLRLEYAGSLINDDDELNGIAFQGVGDGTTVEYVQVHNGQDDCLEWFGGTVNAKYVVCTGADDDSIDWVEGWTGNLQYAIVIQRQNAGSSDPRGIEADNFEDFPGLTPISNPTVSNFTLVGDKVGGDADTGMNLRRGTFGNIVNGIIVNWLDTGLDIETAETLAAFNTPNSGDGQLQSIFLADNTDNFETAGTETIFDAGNNNTESGSTVITSTNIIPGTAEGSVVAIDPQTYDADFFDSVDYIGAVENASDLWWSGWTVTVPTP